LPGHEAIHPQTICLAAFPAHEPAWALSGEDEVLMALFQETVTILRNERADRKLTHRVKADLYLQPAKAGEGEAGLAFLSSGEGQRLLGSIAGVQRIIVAPPPAGAVNRSVRQGVEITPLFEVPVEAVDVAKLELELAKCEDNIGKVRARLESADFASKAPAAVVEGARKNLAALELERARLRTALGLDSEPG